MVKVNYRDGVAKALNPALDETLPPNPGTPSPGADVGGQLWALATCCSGHVAPLGMDRPQGLSAAVLHSTLCRGNVRTRCATCKYFEYPHAST